MLIVSKFDVRELTLVLDDTLCPKWGKHIFGAASFFDHVRRPRPGFIWGHNWVVMAVVIRLGDTSTALPFWIKLYRLKSACAPGQFRTRHQLAEGVLLAVRAWFSGSIRLLADGAYANQSLIGPAVDLGITLISRLRSDARLHAPQPARRSKSKRGRKPKFGARLPALSRMARTRSAFKPHPVRYGKSVALLLREFEAYWPAVRRVVKVVITRDPRRPKRVAYLPSAGCRLVFRGTLIPHMRELGMYTFLKRSGVRLLDYKPFVLAMSERAKEAALRAARGRGRPIRYLQSSKIDKEELARQLLEEHPTDEGPICALTTVEPCASFEYHRSRDREERGLKVRLTKCLPVYPYQFHPSFGFLHARIQTWFPFNVQICLNGREWAAARVGRKLRLLRAHGIIQKVPKTHRYRLTQRGQLLTSALFAARSASLKQLVGNAA